MEKDSGFNKVHVLPQFSNVTGEVIVEMFFNEDLSNKLYKGQTLTIALSNILERIGKTIYSPQFLFLGLDMCKKLGFFKDVRQDIAGIREMIREMVHTKKEKFIANGKVPKEDMTEHLFKYLDDHPDEGMTESDIVDDQLTFFLAGTDTTAHVT